VFVVFQEECKNSYSTVPTVIRVSTTELDTPDVWTAPGIIGSGVKWQENRDQWVKQNPYTAVL